MVSRRDFLARGAVGLAAGVTSVSCRAHETDLPVPRSLSSVLHDPHDWQEIRDQFSLSPDFIHMSALYVASHPRPVREAIETYRRELDMNPVAYLNEQNRQRVNDVLVAAADYLGVRDRDDIALTDSTTMGLGLVYNGLQLRPGDEVITTTRDYYVTHESLRLASLRANISVQRVPLYEDLGKVSQESLTEALVGAIGPRTRALALTWVHSGTGLKLPLARICEAVRDVNSSRDEAAKVLVCVDGVHGFGVEDVTMPDLGCDFFVAGCHKWLFGPRGTGLVWGNPRGWERALPTVPSFQDDGTREAWITGTDVSGRTSGRRMSPGGFKPFEHQWAITEAFAFHRAIGKARVAARTHELASQLKEGLSKIRRVTLRTPLSPDLSSGIVCFDIDGMSPFVAVAHLREHGVVATVTPYAERHARFSPSIRNTPEEVETVLREVRALT
jgi:isopenicillin-N epimerase